MTVKEVRQTGNFLYSRSAQYIVNIFIITGTLITFTQLFATSWIGLIATLLIAPIELGGYRALLKAYDRNAKEVKTKEYILMGFKEYKKYAPIFIGKMLYIWLVQAVIVTVGVLIFSRSSMNTLPLAFRSVWSGNASLLIGNVDVQTGMANLTNGTFESGITMATLIFSTIAQIVGFIMSLYYVLTFYYAVDQDRDLGDSLRDSRLALTGNIMNYIKLVLGYAIRYIASIILISIVNSSLNSLAYMILQYIGEGFRPVVIIAFQLLMAFVTTLVAIILYEVKMKLSVTVFYKELEKAE